MELFTMENVQRPCLQFKSTDIGFLQLKHVGKPTVCFEISLIWLEPRYNHGAKA